MGMRRFPTADPAPPPRRRPAPRAQGPKARDLIGLHGWVDDEQGNRTLLGRHVLVDADHDLLLLLDRALGSPGALLDLPLEEPRLDRLERAAHPVDLPDERAGALHEPGRQR